MFVGNGLDRSEIGVFTAMLYKIRCVGTVLTVGIDAVTAMLAKL